MKDCGVTVQDLIKCIDNATSAPIAANYFEKVFSDAGFQKYSMTEEYGEIKSGRYYVRLFDNAIAAFTIGGRTKELKIVSAHIDCPSLVIKPNCDMVSENVWQLNTEVYGGPILNTWFDRPLSVSGKVAVKQEGNSTREQIEIRYVDFKRPLLVLPNLAVHMNREVNNGVAINKQKELIPIMAFNTESDVVKEFEQVLAAELDVSKDDILDYELYVYNCQSSVIAGVEKDIIMAPRLDNMTSSFTAVKALCQSKDTDGINMVVLYDNEEVGSKTKQGAAAVTVNMLLKKIYNEYGIDNSDANILNGVMVSVDVAHATHPNYKDKSDPTNGVHINSGIVIKKACSQSYATDVRTSAMVKLLCEKNNIPYQTFVNRSDMPGGSTLGAIASTVLPMQTVDIGIPLLAMHSAYETGGVKDQLYMEEFLKAFFQEC